MPLDLQHRLGQQPMASTHLDHAMVSLCMNHAFNDSVMFVHVIDRQAALTSWYQVTS